MINVEQVVTALISGFVALLVAGITAILTLKQERRERLKWLIDVKVAWSLELHKARMATYPEVHKALSPLSHTKNPTRQIAGSVARELNEWLYSAGGLFADATTRGALLGLRECCSEWSEGKRQEPPPELYEWRNLMSTFLRRDLDVLGLDSYDFETDETLLSKLQKELDHPQRTTRSVGLRV